MNNKSILEVDQDGNKHWKLNGVYHRIDGPAFISKYEDKYWYQYGKLHRIDGPAIIFSTKDKYWFLNNISITKEEWFQQLSQQQQYNYLWNLDLDE